MSWYVDSWAVLDGLAFVSLRPPDSIKAEATVFLSVPDLEPVPVGRISTALRAQRNCFQDRFCDEFENEFAFDTLGQVQETIRRGYLGGGLAPPAPIPLREAPIEPLLSGGAFDMPVQLPLRSGGAYFEKQLTWLSVQPGLATVRIDYSVLQNPTLRKKTLEGLHQKATPGLYQYLRAFGEATLLEFVYVRRDDLLKTQVREAFNDWIALLYSAGLWDSVPQLSQFLVSEGLMQLVTGSSDPGAGPARWLSVNGPDPLGRKDFAFRVPCPLRSGWDPHIRSLHHKFLLPLVDRTYYESNREVSEFIPLLFCSLAFAVGPSFRAVPSPFQENDRHRLLGKALFWLTSELPSVMLPDGVEQALTDFSWAQLQKNSSTGDAGPAPLTQRPSGNPPLDPAGSTAAPVPRYIAPHKVRDDVGVKIVERKLTSTS